ncbi:Maltase-glucoamylase, intestinal protein [Quillaja saponaria]|uniref:Maltase-glucoamylase, intestinal protein n=1 Tax=Quillaja saponaria TaxID=32244 RepID=A0AAD7Q7R2_QUISA|nr:Maltase-glucoamylase, intestinal protein [Quillaja saponaria]
MAEETTLSPPPSPAFLEVNCRSSGRTRRFAVGTDAGFAVSLINRKLNKGNPFVWHIESVQEGDEPIAFGPNSVLVDYGHGWKLQTVTEADLGVGVQNAEDLPAMPMPIPIPIPIPIANSSGAACSAKRVSKPQPVTTSLYIGKIVLAFSFIFVFGAIFTLALENLPSLILFIKSAM